MPAIEVSGLIGYVASELGAGSAVVAYIDPGTGSMIFQWIIAGFIGAAFAIKMSWRRIASFFKKEAGDSADDV